MLRRRTTAPVRRPAGEVAKRLLDIAGCVAALPLVLPLGAVIAAAVRLSGPGPVLHRAERVGRHGRPIVVLKFRTMRVGACGPGVTRAGDDRITPVGRLLRRSALDELPQLLNVLRGDMSLVGPRPEDPRFVAAYTAEQREVLSVRPGLASLAFLRFGHEQEWIERAGPVDTEAFYLAEVLPAKLEIELGYVRGRSVRGDLRILTGTVRGLLGRPAGARP